MDDTLIQLAKDIIDMRKNPLRENARERYPKVAQVFSQQVAACEDFDTLREVIRIDSGHVLPTPTKQTIYEKLLSSEEQRTPALLRAFAMHLVMFGYTDTDGTLVHDTDAMVNQLYAEADNKKQG